MAARRKFKGRIQPYRDSEAPAHLQPPTGRPLGPTLDAMLKGRPTYLPNPGNRQRAMVRKVGRGRGR
jgi:hypothetical protein